MYGIRTCRFIDYTIQTFHLTDMCGTRSGSHVYVYIYIYEFKRVYLQ